MLEISSPNGNLLRLSNYEVLEDTCEFCHKRPAIAALLYTPDDTYSKSITVKFCSKCKRVIKEMFNSL